MTTVLIIGLWYTALTVGVQYAIHQDVRGEE
jgi:hypothetical protein